MNQVAALVPGIATSAGAVQALAQRFAMQTVIDILEIEGRRALLPDSVISNILDQLHVNTTYEPLLCRNFLHQCKRFLAEVATESCIYVGSTVTGICPKGWGAEEMSRGCKGYRLETLTTNIIMANWPVSMWQNVVDKALRFLRSGPFWIAFIHGYGHCQLKLKVNSDIIKTNIFI
ncbi:hypothetical protein KIN20_029611 [Parelaphostrongylus tenuis]|uniref:Uncharacterized protein n=1 Tax=Parelaphostrongylus tenuis TaxID=148309 RepID=A0AAD5R2R8_PARTN|nr:hypothetical protein KIN20_029611 [Parelaphostrongylus tenuis]